MKKSKTKGFTLVELIVVLVILAILAAIMVPALLGYIDRAKKKQLILECRSAVIAAQGLYSESYGLGTVVTEAGIKELAGVEGDVPMEHVEVKDHIVEHLTYSKNSQTVTFCRNYEDCGDHAEAYTFEDGGGGADPTDPETDPTESETDPIIDPTEKFSISDGTNTYWVACNGNLAEKMMELSNGESLALTTGTVFFAEGNYYCVIQPSTVTKNDTIQTALTGKKIVKIDTSQFVNPVSTTVKGSLVLKSGKVYVYNGNMYTFNQPGSLIEVQQAP